MLQFEHFVPVSECGLSFSSSVPLCAYFRRSKGGACFLLKEFEAEHFQCVDVVLSMRVEGVVELF